MALEFNDDDYKSVKHLILKKAVATDKSIDPYTDTLIAKLGRDPTEEERAALKKWMYHQVYNIQASGGRP
jgi:hypothetical protein